jgi:alanine dehydrogenase
MIVGVPTEVKTREYRVGMIPAGVRTLASRGHKVLVQAGAGVGSGIPDEAYAGARLDEHLVTKPTPAPAPSWWRRPTRCGSAPR